MKSLLSLLFYLLSVSIAISQIHCGFDSANRRAIRNEMLRSERQGQSYQSIISNSVTRSTNTTRLTSGVKVIPVVVHIVHTGNAPGGLYNPTNNDVTSALEYLNKVYNGTWPDMLPLPGGSIAGDMQIKFELAKRTPLNGPTDGIDRVDGNCLPNYVSGGIQLNTQIGCPEVTLKKQCGWDPFHYYNIWVVNKIDGQDGYGGNAFTGAYAYAPLPVVEDLDGTVILAKSMVAGNPDLPHEMGHAFDLLHVFEGSSGPNQCQPTTDLANTGDKISDTEPISYNTNIATNPPTPITAPRTGTNTCTGNPYTINTEYNIMNYTIPTPIPSLWFTIKQKERVHDCFNGAYRSQLINADNPALQPPTSNELYNTCTHPNVFTTNDFNCIAAGGGNHVWVGTNKQGLYKFNKTTWEKETTLANYFINDIKTDPFGGIWVAQSGSGSTLTRGGGLEYFQNPTFSFSHFSFLNGMPGHNVRSIYIDPSRINIGGFPLVWCGNQYYEYYSNFSSTYYNGGIGRGTTTALPASNSFITIQQGIELDGFGTCSYIGGNSQEIWAVAPGNYGRTQILVYNAVTNARINTFDPTATPAIPALQNLFGKAVYIDNKNNKWIGKLSDGVAVYTSQNMWYGINFPGIFPTGTYVNSNAITGDRIGNIFIGTNNGLVVYNGGIIDKECSYKLYTTADGLPSNNIKGLFVDKVRHKLLIATDNGIIFWSPISGSSGSNIFVTTASGNLNSPSTWCGGTPPTPNSDVVVKHPIVVTSNITLNSMKCESGGNVTIASGINCTVVQTH